MITRLDKNFTTLAAAPMVRERLKELKTRLTENDLLRMVSEQDENCPVNGSVIICEVEGMGNGEYIINDDKKLLTVSRFNEVL